MYKIHPIGASNQINKGHLLAIDKKVLEVAFETPLKKRDNYMSTKNHVIQVMMNQNNNTKLD